MLLGSYLTFPVTGVRVEGATMFPESEVWKAVPTRASLLTLNSALLQEKINTNPWVKGSVVSKDWDSGIVTVEVEERRAVIAADLPDRRAFVAMDGTELPGSGGADLERVKLGEDQLEDILRFGRVLERSGIRLESVEGVGPGGIWATAGGERVVFSADVGAGQARALEGLIKRHPDAPVYDLRTPGRVVLGASPGEAGEAGGKREG